MDLTAFKAAFPEFADSSLYPTAMLTFWSGIAVNQVNINRWGSSYPYGLQLYTAHMLILAKSSNGNGSGVQASKSVGGVSVSYDTGAVTEEDAGNWNATQYGRIFIRLARQFGAGAISI